MKPHERIWVALDTADADAAMALAAKLRGKVGGVKIGLELFGAAGPEGVRRARELGHDVFLDLKLHDIPNTVAGAAAAVARLGVSFMTVHALGGAEMIRRGVEASAGAAGHDIPAPTVLAVTVLTSHDDASLERLGLAGPCGSAVTRLAELARSAGAGGIVCSPLEAARVREVFPEATVVVPGIRPASHAPGSDDQARVATPAGAVASGADRLVVGRPITAAPDPVAAAEALAAEIES